VQARFLLGPAGSGKTFRCLEEIRAALKKNPEGTPLVFLAPKQATFQLERQLLAGKSLQGFTRLHILSFERLARFIFEKLNVAPPELLSDEGRVMVLRALLMRHEKELKLFSKSARRPGFALQLSQLLGELQQHQLTPAKLRMLAQNKNLRAELRDKLNDLALLHEAYANWLDGHDLQDANCLLDFATDALRSELKTQNSKLKIENLWLDGFAEMTPQELNLLAAILPFCENATLAFCLDESGAKEKENSWLSIWNVVVKSFQQCRQRVENLPDAKIEIEILPRSSGRNRFSKNPALQHLEQSWSQPNRNPESRIQNPENAVQIVACQNVETEAIFAAREILKFVRAGNRFRDCAVLVRSLGNYHKPLAREFRRYGIPLFLDRRESVAHHPLAELTRSALKMVAFEWENEDWYAALKTGFILAAPDETVKELEEKIDLLENASLEFGWRGKKWREPLPDNSFENFRKRIIQPFENFYNHLAKLRFRADGIQLAEGLRELWNNLSVEKTLENWGTANDEHSQIHFTVWKQMNLWADNLEMGFSKESLSLREWLPILEAALENLMVGVVPIKLDEVLIGAVDRARNPDLKLALVLGMNETIFPSVPNSPAILTDADRDELTISLGASLREQISRERFYGYIACTRASKKLVVTFSRQDADGKLLNPSPFIAHLQQIFPALEIEEFQNEVDLNDAEHANEIIAPLIQIQMRAPHPVWRGEGEKFEAAPQHSFAPPKRGEGGRRPDEGVVENWNELLLLPALSQLAENLRELREPNPEENLSPQIAEKLYGSTLRTSVSRLEEFAACPFRFFVRSGLRYDERKVFELDARERGSFQHDILKKFHEQIIGEGKHWRDLTPAEARERIHAIADGLTENYRDGLLRDTAESRFTARALAESLQDFVAVIVAWLRGQNEFDPVAAELDFGTKESPQTAWEIDLDGRKKLALTGRIDRVDLFRDENGSAAAIVLDYKSSQKKLDALFVEHGIQLQLLAYLNVLRHWKNPQEIFGAKRLIPAGVFYVNLRGEYKGGGSRAEILADADAARRMAYRHTGRFDAGALDKLDSANVADQFNYRRNNDGSLRKGSVEAMPREEFEKLLDGVEIQLREMGERIFSGAAQVDPYRKGKQTPCEFCDYQAACRIDKWTHHYRVLRAAGKEIVSDIPEPS